MKLSKSLLSKITLSMGMLITAGATCADERPVEIKPAPPVQEVVEAPVAVEGGIAICREAPVPMPVPVKDNNVIRNLTAKEMMSLYDSNRDGKISKEEFIKIYQAVQKEEHVVKRNPEPTPTEDNCPE